MAKDSINIKNIDELYSKYEKLALYISHKISASIYFFPKHILEEIEQEARYSLIKSLNCYSKKYKNNKTVSLRTFICWRLYDHIGDWLARHCGAKTFETQSKFKLIPQYIEDLKIIIEEEHYDSPDEQLQNKENIQLAKDALKEIKNNTRLSHVEWDIIELGWTEFKKKYPRKLSVKQYDNRRQKIRSVIRMSVKRQENT